PARRFRALNSSYTTAVASRKFTCYSSPHSFVHPREIRMARRSYFLVLLLGFSSFALLHGQEGRLERVREEGRNPGTEEADKPANQGSCEDDDDGWGSIFSELFGPAIGYVVLAPFWGPHVLLGDDLQSNRLFLAHPYQAGYPGYYAPDPAG